MDWVEATVDAFGESMGIQGLRLDEDGLLALNLEGGAELAIQDLRPQGSPQLLVALTKACDADPEAGLRAALRRSDFRRSPNWTVQVGLDERELLINIRLPIGAVMLSSLEEAVDLALAVHREANRGT